MIASHKALAKEIHDLAVKLADDGWDRLRGIRLIHAITQAKDACEQMRWVEAIGRAQTLIDKLTSFVSEMPTSDRLMDVLSLTERLADLLQQGLNVHLIEQGVLPKQPEGWRFVLAGDLSVLSEQLAERLADLGFEVVCTPTFEALWAIHSCENTLVLAPARWLVQYEMPFKGGRFSFLIAVCDTHDFLIQVKARQLGARLLIDFPIDISRLILELAGLAWMPEKPYRVLIVDDDESVLSLHAEVLRGAGLEVVGMNDPVSARDFIEEFSPEACVLDVEMPACKGTDLAALLRRTQHFSQLPLIYLSAFSDTAHQLDARSAGGEDYLIKPIDARMLIAAVKARARQFRLFKIEHAQQEKAWEYVAHLTAAIDVHSIVSVASADGSIIEANQKFCEISGYTREELIGRNHRILKSSYHSPSFFKTMWETISIGKTWAGEIKNRKKDGTYYWVQSSIVPVCDENGIPKQYISVRTEITEQKRLLAEKERKTRQLDLLLHALQQFIDHQNIEETTHLLLDAMLVLTESAYGFLGEVFKEEDRFHFTPHALSNLAAEDLQHVEYLVHHRLASGDLVLLDLKNLGQQETSVFQSTLTSFLGIPVYHSNQFVGVIGLANRVGGYSLELVEFLQPFVATYAAILGATQLQMLQQKMIEELREARDAAEWETRVQRDRLLQLSRPSQASVESERVFISPVRQAPMRSVLVAQDHSEQQAVFKMQLNMLGFSAEFSTDGVEALLKYQNQRFDLVLTNYLMPYMDGLELSRAIRAKERETGRFTPIVMMSSSPLNAEELRRCQLAGVNEFLAKPIQLETLRMVLTQGLENHCVIPAIFSEEVSASIHPAVPDVPIYATLDVQYLYKVIGITETEAILELIGLFQSHARELWERCKQVFQERQRREMLLIFQQLKSSATMMGAARLAYLIEQLESTTKTEPFDVLVKGLEPLEKALEDIDLAVSRLHLPPFLKKEDTCTLPITCQAQTVFVIDSDPVTRRQLTLLFNSMGIQQVEPYPCGQLALAALPQFKSVDILFMDLRMQKMDGIELMRALADQQYKGSVILCSAVDERLLQSAAEFAKAKGLNLRGALKKPLTREAVLSVLQPAFSASVAVKRAPEIELTSQMIQWGMRDNEFEIHFQPKVDAMTLEVVGVEALARWTHQGRFIPPDLFIQKAEEEGLIGQLSEILIIKALEGGARLAEAGFTPFLAVNLSATWLTNIDLPEFILSSIEERGFRAEHLILEMTETGVMADRTTALDVMTRLRLKGFKLSIDDFGTGYSSLEQLQRFPFGELKLDRSFVRGAEEQAAARAILASTLDLAHKLKLSTVAEGVETEADLDLVRGLGCHLIQGWFIAKAMPVEQLIKWIQTRGQ